jgi:hypothetical protein
VAGRIKWIEEFNDFIGSRTRDREVCSIVPEPTMLPRAQILRGITRGL